MMIRDLSAILAAACLFSGCTNGPAAPPATFTGPCLPPEGAAQMMHPEVDPLDRLVARTETVIIDRPIPVVRSAGSRSLEDTIDSSNRSLPSVAGTYDLNSVPEGGKGSRRVVCLTDGSTIMEEVLERIERDDYYEFRYVVWNYTSETARPIRYGVGQFIWTPTPEGHTKVDWTYGFRLKGDAFPGNLGAFGEWLFRINFLDGSYARMMRGTLEGNKAHAEAYSAEGL